MRMRLMWLFMFGCDCLVRRRTTVYQSTSHTEYNRQESGDVDDNDYDS